MENFDGCLKCGYRECQCVKEQEDELVAMASTGYAMKAHHEVTKIPKELVEQMSNNQKTELRTLNELHTAAGPFEDSDVDDFKKVIRQEVIKWIKSYKGEGYDALRTFHFKDITISIPARIQRDGMIGWAEVFFNITEDDIMINQETKRAGESGLTSLASHDHGDTREGHDSQESTSPGATKSTKSQGRGK